MIPIPPPSPKFQIPVFRWLGYVGLAVTVILAGVFLLMQALEVEGSLVVLIVSFLIDGITMFSLDFLANRAFQRRLREYEAIDLYGTAAQASVTYFSPNYLVRVQRQFPYTVIGYTFTAIDGQTYTVQDRYVMTEAVQGSGLKEGSSLQIKYRADDPRQSIITHVPR